MGTVMTLALICGAVYLDARMLRARCPELFRRRFPVGPGGWAALTVAFLAIAGPVYYVRRHRFLKAVEAIQRGEYTEDDAPAANLLRDAAAPDTSPERATETAPEPQITRADAEGAPSDGPANDAASAPEPVHRAPPVVFDVPNFRTIADASGILIVYTLVTLVTAIVVALIVGSAGRESALSLGVAVALSSVNKVILVALIYRLSTAARTESFGKMVSLRSVRLDLVRDIGVPVVLGAGLGYAAYRVVGEDVGTPVSPLGLAIGDSGMAGLLIFALAAILLAPVLEEIIFRGYFYRVVERVKGPLVAFAVISAAFLLTHISQLWGDWLAIAVLIPVSLALTGMRLWTGHLIPGIILHLAYNLSLFVIPLAILSSGVSPSSIVAADRPETSAQEQEMLREIIRDNPDATEAYNNLAWSYATEGVNLEEALSLIEVALQHDPDNHAYRDTKAEVLYQLGRYEEAVEIERELVEARPNDPFLQQQLEKFVRARGGQ